MCGYVNLQSRADDSVISSVEDAFGQHLLVPASVGETLTKKYLILNYCTIPYLS